MRDFCIEYMPLISCCLRIYFSERSSFFWSPIIPTIIERIVYDNTNDINLMTPVPISEICERAIQQWKPNRCKKFRPDRNKDVTGCVICGLSEYRFGWRAIYQDKVFVLKILRDKSRQNSWIRLERANQVIRKIKS